MRFKPLPLAGAFLLEPELHEDERGFFERLWCRRELAERGLNAELAQCSFSYNRQMATLRGMHYQAAPHAETKIVRCAAGAIFDVIVDLRPESPTRGRWHGVELTRRNRQSLYVPEGFAHGFQTLEDDTEVLYLISAFHEPTAARGIRWDDPAINIRWPLSPSVISARDRSYDDWSA
ncbi:MAG: dTDP-4-dehydrorhamnose 3,5-epimerase [Planctomycetes bacterium]|nr:dTDP-4-dehydrorhamnose 3,5-epimerase [Planctomycetota bacterium]